MYKKRAILHCVLRNILLQQMNLPYMKKAFLLVNLGTPDSPNPKDVKRYLTEFLLDPKVIDIPWILRQTLVRGVIIPKRLAASSKSYQDIWTKEGSPLLFHTKQLRDALQEKFEAEIVSIAMRYQNPSIKDALKELQNEGVTHLTVLPLFPQYAEATSGSIIERVKKEVKNLKYKVELKFIPHFFGLQQMAKAFAEQAKDVASYDHVLMSFHGLPERQLFKRKPAFCYRSHCFFTAKNIARELELKDYSVCFQSRLGKEEWLKPYASDVIANLAKKGVKRLLVFSPSFVTDCLETIYEIAEEYQKEFIHLGGERLDLVPSLNNHPTWVSGLELLLRLK